MEAFWLLIGGLVGIGVGVYVGLLRGRSGAERHAAALEEVRARLADSESERAAVTEAIQKEKVAAAESLARLESAREHFAEQRRQFAEMESKLKEAFEALSAKALDRNNDRFTLMAEEKLKPLREQLKNYETQIKQLEEKRATAYGDLNQRLRKMDEGREQLSTETRLLAAALRQPGAKGRWGEVGLRNVVELSGLSAYCDFDEQASVQGEAGVLRPDMTVQLPGGGHLVVDAKVNVSSYLDAVEAHDDAERQRHLIKYVNDVRGALDGLSRKDYARQFERAPEFVVMFMPSEAFFAAAVAQDKHLIARSIEKRVLVASPSTLAALLMAIKQGWQRQEMTDNAEDIARAGRELYDRLCNFVGSLDGIRRGIVKAAEAYNQAIGNWERRTMPGVKRLVDLGAKSNKPLPDTDRIELPLRHVPADDHRSDTEDRDETRQAS